MITQDIVKKLWDEAGYGNVTIRDNDTMTHRTGRL
jgi:ribulose-5-phosphate 4-epimerase/fuculose-1-phosphate aldolase